MRAEVASAGREQSASRHRTIRPGTPLRTQDRKLHRTRSPFIDRAWPRSSQIQHCWNESSLHNGAGYAYLGTMANHVKKTSSGSTPGTRKEHARSQPEDDGSFIGRRVGRARRNLEDALARPEKQRRDAYVDTAAPGQSETNRRAGGSSTARRNSKRSLAGMTATLEDSRTTPSRKSGRRSANRAKSGTPLTARQKGRVSSPQARNIRGK